MSGTVVGLTTTAERGPVTTTVCRTQVTAIYSDLDQMLVPSTAGRCEHPDLRARNVLVRGVGHMSLPIHRGVLDEVALTLAGSPVADDEPVRAAA